MAFRHRHFSLSRLIETAEMELGKAETGEKEAGCEEDESAIRPGSHGILPTLCAARVQHEERMVKEI